MGDTERTAAPSDCILSIADAAGRSPGALWIANSDLAAAGREPHALVTGDRVRLPPLEQKRESCVVSRRHRFRASLPAAALKLRLLDMGEPLAGFDYVLEVEGRIETGATSADGLLEVPIPPGAREATLRVEDGALQREYRLALGALEPVSTIAGLQARLGNLGYSPGDIDGIEGPRTAAALARFQRESGLHETGIADDAARGALKDAHGGWGSEREAVSTRYFADDPWYRVIEPEAGPQTPRPVFRQPAGGTLFNTLDAMAPAVALEVDAFAFHHGSSIALPRLPARPTGETVPFRNGDAAFMEVIRSQRPDLYRRYRDATTEGGGSAHGLGHRAMVLLAVCYRFAERNPRFRLLIAGHTDSSGDDAVNFALSDRRAANVLALLTGDRDAWVEDCQRAPKVEDIQSTLKHIADVLGWGCDPGVIDDEDGPATREAVQRFQARYGEETGVAIAVDGIVGPQTWGAIFECHMGELAALMETTTDALVEHRARLRFVDAARKTIGCGERVPLSGPYRDHFRSKTDRRVEIMFFHEARPPSLSAHAPGGAMRKASATPEKSDVYAPGLFDFAVLDPVWWTARPPGRPEEPRFKVRRSDPPGVALADERGGERYETIQPVTVPPDEPWDFIDDLDDHHPGTLVGG